MALCPICNGFAEIRMACSKCGNEYEDKGRIMDYYDDYSAYMPIDQLKLEDGFPDDHLRNNCPHLIICPLCGMEEIKIIKE